jgi:stringent starvation protein B
MAKTINALGGYVTDSMSLRTTEKHNAFLELLDGGMTMVHLDARFKGVDVPSSCMGDAHLRLNFSYRFHLETFDITADEITASLTFGGTPYICVIPWESVFAMTHHVTNELRVWEEDLPLEVLQQIGDAMQQEAPTPDDDSEYLEEGVAVRRVGHLKVVK